MLMIIAYWTAYSLIEKLNTASTHDIFVPYSFKTNGDYELGDNFTIHYQGKEYKYQIAGFFETTMMATNNIGVMKFMLPETSYETLADELDNQSKALIVSAVMEDPTQSPELKNDFIQQVQQSTEGETTHYIWGLDIDLVKNVNTIDHQYRCDYISSFCSHYCTCFTYCH